MGNPNAIVIQAYDLPVRSLMPKGAVNENARGSRLR